MIVQRTIGQDVLITGHGLHSAAPARLRLRPAPVDAGIAFQRVDCHGSAPIPARWDCVEQTALCTKLVGPDGVGVSTIEHLMAAIAGMGIDNLSIEIDGPEVPILDGSAQGFVSALCQARVIEQPAARQLWRVAKAVEVRRDQAVARLEPAIAPEMRFEIAFADGAIGHQTKHLPLANGAFLRELADSRTFCRRADVAAMQAIGLARGGSLDNAVVVDGEQVLNPGGLRHPDEAVRHKMLDAVGDLALAGGAILGRYTGIRAGHSLTNQLLREAFATPGAMVKLRETPEISRVLPGASLAVGRLAEAV